MFGSEKPALNEQRLGALMVDTVHGRTVVGTQEAHSFLGHLGEFEERHHLEAGFGVSWRSVVDEVGGITHPPLSAAVSVQSLNNIAQKGSTCKNVVWP